MSSYGKRSEAESLKQGEAEFKNFLESVSMARTIPDESKDVVKQVKEIFSKRDKYTKMYKFFLKWHPVIQEIKSWDGSYPILPDDVSRELNDLCTYISQKFTKHMSMPSYNAEYYMEVAREVPKDIFSQVMFLRDMMETIQTAERNSKRGGQGSENYLGGNNQEKPSGRAVTEEINKLGELIPVNWPRLLKRTGERDDSRDEGTVIDDGMKNLSGIEVADFMLVTCEMHAQKIEKFLMDSQPDDGKEYVTLGNRLVMPVQKQEEEETDDEEYFEILDPNAEDEDDTRFITLSDLECIAEDYRKIAGRMRANISQHEESKGDGGGDWGTTKEKLEEERRAHEVLLDTAQGERKKWIDEQSAKPLKTWKYTSETVTAIEFKDQDDRLGEKYRVCNLKDSGKFYTFEFPIMNEKYKSNDDFVYYAQDKGQKHVPFEAAVNRTFLLCLSVFNICGPNFSKAKALIGRLKIQNEEKIHGARRGLEMNAEEKASRDVYLFLANTDNLAAGSELEHKHQSPLLATFKRIMDVVSAVYDVPGMGRLIMCCPSDRQNSWYTLINMWGYAKSLETTDDQYRMMTRIVMPFLYRLIAGTSNFLVNSSTLYNCDPGHVELYPSENDGTHDDLSEEEKQALAIGCRTSHEQMVNFRQKIGGVTDEVAKNMAEDQEDADIRVNKAMAKGIGRKRVQVLQYDCEDGLSDEIGLDDKAFYQKYGRVEPVIYQGTDDEEEEEGDDDDRESLVEGDSGDGNVSETMPELEGDKEQIDGTTIRDEVEKSDSDVVAQMRENLTKEHQEREQYLNRQREQADMKSMGQEVYHLPTSVPKRSFQEVRRELGDRHAFQMQELRNRQQRQLTENPALNTPKQDELNLVERKKLFDQHGRENQVLREMYGEQVQHEQQPQHQTQQPQFQSQGTSQYFTEPNPGYDQIPMTTIPNPGYEQIPMTTISDPGYDLLPMTVAPQYYSTGPYLQQPMPAQSYAQPPRQDVQQPKPAQPRQDNQPKQGQPQQVRDQKPQGQGQRQQNKPNVTQKPVNVKSDIKVIKRETTPAQKEAGRKSTGKTQTKPEKTVPAVPVATEKLRRKEPEATGKSHGSPNTKPPLIVGSGDVKVGSFNVRGKRRNNNKSAKKGGDAQKPEDKEEEEEATRMRGLQKLIADGEVALERADISSKE